ncbi:MAG: hypothetical protein M9887_05390 [Chitinophagales bacterium]|nr:hypothetical protein [Chitinophagales bacterium]
MRNLGNTWKFYTDIFLPESIFHLNAIARSLILGLTIFFIFFRKAFSLQLWWSRFKSFSLDWWMLTIVATPTLISVIFIFPREHYMVLQLLFTLSLLLSFSYGFTGWENVIKDREHIGMVSAIVLALVIFAPNPKNRAYFDNFREPKGNFNVQAAQLLENFELLKDTIAISEDEGGIICFLPTQIAQHYKWTPALRKEKTPFNHFADSLHTQLYYVTPLMLYDDRYLYDNEWQDFLKTYPERGFKKKTIADEWYFLYDTTALKIK